MVRRYLLSIKADVGPGRGFEESSRFAAEFMRLKLGDMRTILCHVPDNQWKARQFGHVILHVALNSADVEKIYRWFNETTGPAPFPDGTLLYFQEMEKKP